MEGSLEMTMFTFCSQFPKVSNSMFLIEGMLFLGGGVNESTR